MPFWSHCDTNTAYDLIFLIISIDTATIDSIV